MTEKDWNRVRTILLPSDIVAVPRRAPADVPPERPAEPMSAEAAAFYEAARSHIRFILVPQDIVGVRPRRQPDRARGRRTPVRPEAPGSTTLRAGGREWFADSVFVEAQEGHGGLGYGTSLALHVCGVAAVAVLLALRPAEPLSVSIESSLAVKVWIAPPKLPAAPAEGAAIPPARYRPVRREAAAAAAPPLPVPQSQPDALTAAPPPPVEAPASISAESAPARGGTVEGGVAGGTPGGVAGGVPGGIPGGAVGGVVGGTPPVVRAGPTVAAPRKIKDVRPAYPEGALNERSRGNVILEITVGPDGRVRDAKVVRSIPLLDQAALDAVRQWEYAPPTWKGQPVSVIVTVVVNFDIR